MEIFLTRFIGVPGFVPERSMNDNGYGESFYEGTPMQDSNLRLVKNTERVVQRGNVTIKKDEKFICVDTPHGAHFFTIEMFRSIVGAGNQLFEDVEDES